MRSVNEPLMFCRVNNNAPLSPLIPTLPEIDTLDLCQPLLKRMWSVAFGNHLTSFDTRSFSSTSPPRQVFPVPEVDLRCRLSRYRNEDFVTNRRHGINKGLARILARRMGEKSNTVRRLFVSRSCQMLVRTSVPSHKYHFT